MGSHGGGGGGGSGYESPMVKQELAKLDMGGEKRRSALASLRACVEKLDASSVPRFLSQVGDVRDLSDSRPLAISLYQDVARVHGRLVAPEIPRIMATITRSLSSSGSSIHLHESCARVVAALLRHAISPLSAMVDAATVIPDVCNPLLDVLCARMEPLAAGAAACLQAAVESDKWKYAPRDVAVAMCSRTGAALRDRSGQTIGHIQLARSLVRAGAVGNEDGVGILRATAEILRANSVAAWQQRAAALQLIRALLASLDKQSLAKESEAIRQIIEHIRRDRMPHVRSEAVKALQALRTAQISSSLNASGAVLMDGVADVVRSCTGLGARSAGPSWHRREEVGAVSQESQVMSSSPPGGLSPESSSSKSNRRYSSVSSRRYSVLPPAERRTGSSSTCSSICTSDDADALDCFAPHADPCMVNGVEAEKEDLDESLLDDLCAASGESCVVDESGEEVLAITRSTNGRYGQSPASSKSDELGNNDGGTPERSASALTAEDFTKYTTPRRLVRSLQALASTPDGGDLKLEEDTVLNDTELEQEPMDAGWSVRDNPIAFNDRLQQHEWQQGECDAPVFREQVDDGKQSKGAAGAKRKKKKTSWKITRDWIEFLLGAILVLLLLLPLAMAVVLVVFDRQDTGLVPT